MLRTAPRARLPSSAALLLGVVLGIAAPAHAQNAAQQHVLDAAINLGWATGIVESDGGVTAANAAEVGEDLERAAAHIRALRGMVPNPPYDPATFAAVEQAIDELAGEIGGMSGGDAAWALRHVYQRYRRTVAIFLSARSGRLTRGTTCDSAYADFGYAFGVGHTASQRGDAGAARRARDQMRRAASRGGYAARQLACNFDHDGLLGLPVIEAPADPNAYARALPVAQRLARGGAAPPSAPSAPSPSEPARPDLSCDWRSTRGTVHFTEGYYGSRNRTLEGGLHRDGDQWVWRGRWARADSDRHGTVELRFVSATRFRGRWVEQGAHRRSGPWTGTRACEDD